MPPSLQVQGAYEYLPMATTATCSSSDEAQSLHSNAAPVPHLQRSAEMCPAAAPSSSLMVAGKKSTDVQGLPDAAAHSIKLGAEMSTAEVDAGAPHGDGAEAIRAAVHEGGESKPSASGDNEDSTNRGGNRSSRSPHLFSCLPHLAAVWVPLPCLQIQELCDDCVAHLHVCFGSRMLCKLGACLNI